MKSLPRIILLAVLAPAAYSQSVLYTFDGDSGGDQFGFSVSGAGDLNGDGFADVIVGAFRDYNNGPISGSARVFSGVDGSILYNFDGDSAFDHFGWSVSGAGDVNGDGYDDVIVGANADDNNGSGSGSARVCSGIDGSVLYTFDGDSKSDWFGYSVSGAGDVNGDGYADLIVGAPNDGNNGSYSGSARVFSGLDGSILYTFDGASAGDRFGWSVSGAGDVNGDGYPDLIVGVKIAEYARVFSGMDGSLLYTFNIASVSSFGRSVSGAGDVNADGFADLIVSAYQDDHNGLDSGSARVFSGLDGRVLYTFYGHVEFDRFGWSVSGAGDVNGDGFADMVVGAYGDDTNGSGSGSARVLSGQNGSVLNTFYGDSPGDAFGWSVSSAGNVNGDGYANLIVGAYRDDNNGADSGSARVFSGWGPIGTTYCSPAVGNSTGLPASIQAIGIDAVAENVLYLRATGLPIMQFGYFLASENQGFVAAPGGSQGNLCLGGHIGRFRKQTQDSGTDGRFTIQVDLTSIPPTPPHTVIAGETWNFQAWFRDLNPGPTSNFTDAVSVLFK